VGCPASNSLSAAHTTHLAQHHQGLAHISAHEPRATPPPTTKPQVKDLGLLCARGELNPHALSGTRT